VEQTNHTELRSCPTCGSQNRIERLKTIDHTVSKETFSIQQCVDCGLHYTCPSPPTTSIGAYYESDAYISHTDRKRGVFERIYHAVRKRAVAHKIQLIQHYRPGGNLLDLGAGTGTFAQAARSAGYSVSAVEPSAAARRVAAECNGIEAAISLETLSPVVPLHVVTMWHVLEHLHTPVDTLRALHQRMASQALLVIAVPNRASWDAHYYGPSWAAWDVPRHLSHFDEQDLEKAVSRAGFRLVTKHPMWFDAPYVAILSERIRGRGPVAALMLGGLIGLWSNAMTILLKRPTSSTIYIAEKTGP
jgi:2-polyprenyl-3-methyl-5-hydroxy-6-metoxy-1,4-benzoquinol methylase